jgi:hypothetical protein
MTASTFEYVEEEDDGDLDESVPVEGESYDSKKKYSKAQLEELADALLREDSNKELCRQCKEKDANSLPYGSETGHTEWALRKDASGAAVLDDEGNAQYIAFPELSCDAGHRWYKGEGTRRNINGKNPILFEQHIYNRKRREIHVKDGIPDPAFTTDRWGRPTVGMYHRTHPQGRKVNSTEQRKKKMGPVTIANAFFGLCSKV